VGLQIGSEQFLATEFYQPLDHAQRGFVRPFALVDSRAIGLYDEGTRIADYTFRDTRLGLDAGLNLGIYGQARVGWLQRWTNLARDTGFDILPNFKNNMAGPTVAVSIDNEDQAYFPTKGIQARLDYFNALHTDSASAKYSRVSGSFEAVKSFGDFAFIGELEGGTTIKGELPAGDLFSLGGPRHLSAFANDQILGGQYEYGRLETQWRLTKPIPLLGLNVFGGVLLEAGRMRKTATEDRLSGKWLNSYGAYIAANTPLGPVYFGYSDSKEGSGRFYLFIGTP
jgi:NTE family protein